LLGQHVYLLGGRSGTLPLKDFWRYHVGDNTWERLASKGDTPGCLQEHTMVAHQDKLFVFGGEVGFSSAAETPLWIYDVKVINEFRSS